MSDRIDIAVIRARVAAAGLSPSPWSAADVIVGGMHRVVVRAPNGDVIAAMALTLAEQDANATLIAHAPADIAALCDEVERLRAELDDARNVALGAVEDCAGLRASLEEISEASIDLIAAGDKLRASNERLRNVVELDESIYLDLARAAGFDHEPPSDARQCIAVVKAMATERDALRAVIAGRTTTPTGAEVDAHPGAFLWMRMDRGEAVAVTHDGCEREAFDSIAFGFVWFREDLDDELPRATGARWWALDASGAPCAWPAVTEVSP